MVNNAGVMPTFTPCEWTTIEEFEGVCKVNLFGTINVSLTFLPLLRKSRGRLVNVCSVTSNCGYPGITNYVISKAAVKMFTICLRYISVIAFKSKPKIFRDLNSVCFFGKYLYISM